MAKEKKWKQETEEFWRDLLIEGTGEIVGGYYNLEESDFQMSQDGEISLAEQGRFRATDAVYMGFGSLDLDICIAAPPPPPPICNEGEVITQECPGGSSIAIQRCVDNQWVDTGAVCPSPPPENGDGDGTIEDMLNFPIRLVESGLDELGSWFTEFLNGLTPR